MSHLTPTPASRQTRQIVAATASGLHTLGGEDVGPLSDAPVVAVHHAGDDLWALVGGRELHRIADGTAELVATLPDDADGICLGSHRGDVWVGGDRAGLWRLSGGALDDVASFHHAPTRADWTTPWGGPPSVYSIASDGSDLFVSVHVGGILRTSDGETWEATIDLHDDVHQVTVGPDGTVWAATGRQGLAGSADRGATWAYHADGLHARYLLAVAPTSDGVLVGASSGHAGSDGAIYRFDGERFTRGRGLPDSLGGAVWPRHLVAAGESAAVALPDGDVYASDDGGRTWDRVGTAVGDVSEIALVDGHR